MISLAKGSPQSPVARDKHPSIRRKPCCTTLVLSLSSPRYKKAGKHAKKPIAARKRVELGTRTAKTPASGPPSAAGTESGTNIDPVASIDQLKWRWTKSGRMLWRAEVSRPTTRYPNKATESRVLLEASAGRV
jgi:hypothetical protein